MMHCLATRGETSLFLPPLLANISFYAIDSICRRNFIIARNNKFRICHFHEFQTSVNWSHDVFPLLIITLLVYFS